MPPMTMPLPTTLGPNPFAGPATIRSTGPMPGTMISPAGIVQGVTIVGDSADVDR